MIQVEMNLIDCQHTSIFTHSNSNLTTTMIQLSNPWLCPPTSRKKFYCRFHRIHARENFFRMENVFTIDSDHIKRARIMFASDKNSKKRGIMVEGEIGKGEVPFRVVRLQFLIKNLCCGPRNHLMLTQCFCVLELANGIMLQQVIIIHYRSDFLQCLYC